MCVCVQAKDASAPRIESWTKVQKDSRPELLAEVKKADWREDLKHTQPEKDASTPQVRPTTPSHRS